MRITIDTEARTLVREDKTGSKTMPLYSDEAFALIAEQGVKVGWNQKYAYSFSWLGRPIIQLPEDILRIQEVIYRLKPDVIIETGIAHGGSLILSASLCKLIGKGRVIGVDIEIRPHNRKAIEAHELSPLITLIEGSSTEAGTVAQVQKLIRPGETALVILDSCHTKAHVRAELEAYAKFVTVDSYLVATDGIMKDLWDTPRGAAEWQHDHPVAAGQEFLQAHPEFVLEQPPLPFNESTLNVEITHWPAAFLKRVRA